MSDFFDWEANRSAEGWKEVAHSFAGKWSSNNNLMFVDPSFIHWLSRKHLAPDDGRIFNIGDTALRSAYLKALDTGELI